VAAAIPVLAFAAFRPDPCRYETLDERLAQAECSAARIPLVQDFVLRTDENG
jgi:hypothetical protein